MSKEAKVALLQQKIKEASTKRWIAYILAFVSIAPIGFFLGYLRVPEYIAFIIGFPIFITGIMIGKYYGYQKNKLMQELKNGYRLSKMS